MNSNYIPQSYQKRPVSVLAVEFYYSSEAHKELQNFCGDSLIKTQKAKCIDAIGEAFIQTYQGVMKAHEGDYIIKDENGLMVIDRYTFLNEYIKLDNKEIEDNTFYAKY